MMVRHRIKLRSIICTLLVLAVVLGMNGYLGAGNVEMPSPILDGVIGGQEWLNADVDVEFYIDCDNSGNNFDGDNRLLIGEDEDNVYLGLDLVSDQSPDPSSEWLGLWFNTNHQNFSSEKEWTQYLNNGAESLIINVSTNATAEPFDETNPGTNYELYLTNQDDILTPVYYSDFAGTAEGLNYIFDGKSVNITSTDLSGNQVVRYDLGLNFSSFYSTLLPQYIPQFKNFGIQGWISLNTTVDSHQMIVWDSDGTLNTTDPAQTFTLPTAAGSMGFGFHNVGPGNLTAQGILKLSFLVNSSTSPFEVKYDYLICQIQTTPMFDSDFNFLKRPFSTIQNWDYNYSFSPSTLNASAHRQFEIKIPKSELEHFDSNQDLGIVIAGYGTLSFEGSNYWSYSQDPSMIYKEDSAKYMYFDMQGVEPGDGMTVNSPTDIMYDIYQTGFTISWRITDPDAVDPVYTIYRDGLQIENSEWVSGTLIPISVDGLGVGIYNFSIIATDGYGGRIQDDVKVTVVNPGPILTSPADLNLAYDFGSATITWTVTDSTIDSASYIIFVDGVENVTGTWVNGDEIVFNITGFKPGDYTISLLVEDGLGKSFNDDVEVIISIFPPPTHRSPGYPALLWAVSLVTLFWLIRRKFAHHTKVNRTPTS